MNCECAVISVDFELFSHTPAYRNSNTTRNTSGIGLRQTRKLLSILDSKEVEATFFVVSEIAKKAPELLTEIAANHEIGSHTHTHRHLTNLDNNTYIDELERSRRTLSDLTGAPVEGFRAPSFDIGDNHFEYLSEAGYQYDSSVVPSRSIPGWYGGEWTRSRPGPADQFRADAPPDINVLPVSVAPYLRLPLTGTWIRFFGVRYTALGMRALARRGITPVLYFHPWEFAKLPPIEGVPQRVYWRTGEWMWNALKYLLDQPFKYISARDAVF